LLSDRSGASGLLVWNEVGDGLVAESALLDNLLSGERCLTRGAIRLASFGSSGAPDEERE